MNGFYQFCRLSASRLTRSSAFYLAAALVPLFWLVYFAATGVEKNRAVADAQARGSNVTLVYEEHLDSLFLDLDHSLLLLRALYEEDPARFDLKHWVQKAGLISSTVIRFNLVDSLLRDCEQNLETLRQLKNLGVSIALDDFGVGYSSLSYLTSFPFDKIKIDKSFIAKVGRPETGAVITSIVQLAKTLKLSICAEGVETAAQFADVRDQGVELCQGYLFGKPAPLAALKLDRQFGIGEQKVA